MQQEIIDIAKKYYRLVDSGNLDEMFGLFSDTIHYDRAGKEIIGIEALKEFYLNKRRLKGLHEITEIFSLDNKRVLVKGCFNGSSSIANNISIKFIDFLYFSNEFKIEKRETYLNTGFDLVK